MTQRFCFYLRAFLLLALLAAPALLYAQDNRTIGTGARTPEGGPAIQVRWFPKEIIVEGGVRLFRREAGTAQWQELTTTPFRKGDYQIPPAALQADSTLRTYVSVVEQIKPEERQGLMGVFIVIQAVFNPHFARYLALEWTDAAVQEGRSYEYKVVRAASGQELSPSAPVVAGRVQPTAPPQNVKISARNRQADFVWTPEPDRYLATHIYRTSALEGRRRITRLPVLISQLEDEQGRLAYPEIFYSDTTVVPGVGYTYELVAIDFFGRESTPEKVEIRSQDTQPPLPPTGVQTELDTLSGRLLLRWRPSPSDDLAGYTVWRRIRRQGASFSPLNPSLLTDTLYQDAPAVEGLRDYLVSANDFAGNVSYSDTVFLDVPDRTPPAPPSGLRLTAAPGQVTLSWAASPEPDVLGYRVYRSVDQDLQGEYMTVSPELVTGTTFTDRLPGVAKNRFYYYISALDSAANESSPSLSISGQMPDQLPPAVPVLLGATLSGRSVVLRWAPNADPDLAGYQLFRTADSAALQPYAAPLPADQTGSYTDANILSGRVYQYAMVAFDSSGNRSPLSEPVRVVARWKEAVSPPAGLSTRYEAGQKAVLIAWQPVGHPELQGYTVYRRSGEQGNWMPVSGLLTEASYADSRPQAGTLFYEVRAYLKTGEVVRSEPVRLTIE